MSAKGWNTSDEDEVNSRKKRAAKEDFEIVNLKRQRTVFSSFEVKSKNSLYLVELRSLDQNINSCNCPDIEVNKLGACKHIEAVKLLFKDRDVKNKRVEIFLDTRVDKIKILFPKGSKKKSYLKDRLGSYFSYNNELLSEPVIAFESLKRVVENLDNTYKNRVRISLHVESWLEKRKYQLEKIENKKTFLEDYRNGKRSFNFLKYELYDYQKDGVLHLAFNEKALLADDMGLGKTLQAIGASVLLKRLKGISKVLVISPASLKAEWEEQCEKFTDEKTQFIFGNKSKREEQYKAESFFYFANYEQILYDEKIINELLQPDIIILDEAQRIKNWQTKTAYKIKKLQSRYTFVLTGTPIENRIDEIYSIVQVLDPKIFGSLFRFNRDFYQLDHNGMAIGYKNMNLLHQRLKPIMLRRKKNDVEGELPQRREKTYLVQMEKAQQERYDEYETMVSRLASKAKKIPLSFEEMKRLQLGLSCMRILCDSVYILDQKITTSPKIDEVVPIIEELLEEENCKIIIFSEWEKMLQLLNITLQKKGIKVAWHTGSFTQLQRRDEIKKFKEDSSCNLFLSTDSGSVGLNLQVANVVINLDMPWNPAKLEQRIARAWRKHQKNSVQVINLITEDRLEHRIVEIVKQKQFLSDNVLDGLGQDDLKLPSSRQEFLKELDGLIETEDRKLQVTPSTNSSLHFVEDVVAILNDKVELITQSSDNNSIFVVIDKKDESIESKINEIKNKNIQILQKSEYELIKNLMKSGMIEIKGDLETLYKTPSETIKNKDDKKILEANKIFKNVKRKYDMATLLKNGGFLDESLPVFCEMVQISLEILALFEEISYDKKFINYVKNINIEDNLQKEYIIFNSEEFYDALNTYLKTVRT